MATLIEFAVFVVIGALGTNAIPHFVQGITGQRHQTPAGPDSKPVLNVVWGSANAAIAGVLLWVFRDAIEGATLAVVFVVGVLVAMGLANYWTDE